MTVTNEMARNDYNGNNITVNFVVSFYFLANIDIKVLLYNSLTDTETELIETTHYTLTGAGVPAGGEITMITAPTADEQLVILRDVQATQEMDYIEHSNFSAESHERALDKLTMLLQQYIEKFKRIITFRESSGMDTIDIEDLVAGKVLVVNGTSDGICMGDLYVDGFSAATELIIAGGIVTVVGNHAWRVCSIDTEGGVASDDLTNINGGTAGDILVLQAVNNARTVVCKMGAYLKLTYDFSLNNTDDKLILICVSSGMWHELSRSSNGG